MYIYLLVLTDSLNSIGKSLLPCLDLVLCSTSFSYSPPQPQPALALLLWSHLKLTSIINQATGPCCLYFQDQNLMHLLGNLTLQ